MTAKGVNIFEYTDYREFLNDLYLYKKKTVKFFSHRVFVRMCGFSSPNFLKLVIDGERNLGKQAKEKLTASLKLNKLERSYLEALINFDQAKTIEEKSIHLNTISRLRHRAGVATIEVDQYNYLSDWLNVAVRELVSLKDFQEDAAWASKKLGARISEKKFGEIINTLLELNLLTRKTGEKLVQTDSAIICSPDIHSVAINSFHREMLAKASESIEKSKSGDRDLSALTVSLDRDSFEKIRNTIRRCREEIHHISCAPSEKHTVYQINIQLFNLSEAIWN